MVFESKQSQLIKCLECRLVGPPPIFNLPPPPALPKSFLDANSDLFKILKPLKSASSSKRACANLKTYLFKNNIIPKQIIANKNKLESTETDSASQFYLNHAQTLVLFLVCLFVFLVVLFVAFIFLYKLFKIRKQIKTTKLNSNKCLSSSLSSSSSSSSNSKSNTISSQLIITPSSSVLNDSDNANNYSNKVKSLLTFNSTGNSEQLQQNNPNFFYNQLFESTRHLLQSQRLSSDSSELKRNETQHYLQAVPNSSNLIETHINNKYIGEYDEINSYPYPIANENQYNQYDDQSSQGSQSKLNKIPAHTIIQPILPIKPANFRNSAVITHHNGLIFVNSLNPTVVGNENAMFQQCQFHNQLIQNENLNPNFYYVC